MKIIKFLAILIVTSLSLIVIGLFNGYPLVECDTCSYINTAMAHAYPVDRTPFYGYFLRLSSLQISLWFTLIAQSCILSYLLLRYMQLIRRGKPEINFVLINVIIIVSFTCVSWVTSYLMPDVFTAILLLAIILYMLNVKDKIYDIIIYGFIIFIAIAIHNSHVVIVLILSSFLLVYSFVKKNKPLLKRSIFLFLMPVIFWFAMCSLNSIQGLGFTFSTCSHVFIVTRFAEMGLLKTYLDENCGKKSLKQCAYKEQIPAHSWDYLWGKESPLFKTGGWDSNEVEDKIIIHDVLTTPRYLLKFIQKSMIGTFRQLTQIQVQDKALIMDEKSTPYLCVKYYFPDELGEYSISKQNSGELFATKCNLFYYLFFVISSIWVLFHFQSLNTETRFIYLLIISYLIINAFVTSMFSTIVYRLQNRVFWVLPATNAIQIITYYWNWFAQKVENNI